MHQSIYQKYIEIILYLQNFKSRNSYVAHYVIWLLVKLRPNIMFHVSYFHFLCLVYELLNFCSCYLNDTIIATQSVNIFLTLHFYILIYLVYKCGNRCVACMLQPWAFFEIFSIICAVYKNILESCRQNALELLRYIEHCPHKLCFSRFTLEKWVCISFLSIVRVILSY